MKQIETKHRKAYQKPDVKCIKLENVSVICASTDPPGWTGPLG